MASREGYEHGTHVPGQGYYDDTTRSWVDRPDKLTRLGGNQPSTPHPLDGVEFRSTPISTAEAVANNGQKFKPEQHLENLRRLRDTDPASFAKMPPSHKISLGSYEQQLRHHLDGGAPLPAGVRPLPNDAA